MRQRPPSYRSEIAGPILHALHAGECCSVVGISGVGKTNLIAHLQRPDVQRAHLGEAAPLRWALIDANLLARRDGWGLWEGLLEALAHGALSDEERREIDDAHARALAAPEHPAVAIRQAGAALGRLCGQARLVLVFDEFDDLFATLDAGVLRALRGLRDRYKYRLSLLTFTRQRLSELREGDWGAIEPFVELLTLHELGLTPLRPADRADEAARIADRYGRALDPAAQAAIGALSGGHPALIRALVALAHETPAALHADPLSLASLPTLRLECAKIWQQLDGDEQDPLFQLAYSREPATIPAILTLKGLVPTADAAAPTIFSPLLAGYIRQIGDPTGEAPLALQLDHERHRVYLYGQDISNTLAPLEYRLLGYLWERFGQICTLAEIAHALAENTPQGSLTQAHQDALTAIAGLRAVASRLAERLAQLAPPGSPPILSLHRLRGLRLGPPA